MTRQPMTNETSAKVVPPGQALSGLQSTLQLPLQLGRNRPLKPLIPPAGAGRITRGPSRCCPPACVHLAGPSEAAKYAICLAFQKNLANCMLRNFHHPPEEGPH